MVGPLAAGWSGGAAGILLTVASGAMGGTPGSGGTWKKQSASAPQGVAARELTPGSVPAHSCARATGQNQAYDSHRRQAGRLVGRGVRSPGSTPRAPWQEGPCWLLHDHHEAPLT